MTTTTENQLTALTALPALTALEPAQTKAFAQEPIVTPWCTLEMDQGRVLMRLEQNPTDLGAGTIIIQLFPLDTEDDAWIEFSTSFDNRCIGRHAKATTHFDEVKTFLTENPTVFDWGKGFLTKCHKGPYLELFLQDYSGWVLYSEFRSKNESKLQVLKLRFEISHLQYELARLLHALNAVGSSYLLDSYEQLPAFSEDLRHLFGNLDSKDQERLVITKDHLQKEYLDAKTRMTKMKKICSEFD